MTKQTRITANLDGLNRFLAGFGRELITKVGFIGSKGTESHAGQDLTNAEIAFIHEFGSYSNNIPQRSILQMPLHSKQKEIVKQMGKGSAKRAVEENDPRKLYTILGIAAQAVIQQAFETRGFGNWPENSPVTIAKKGSSSPLIDTGQLRRSVSSEVVNRSGVI